MRSRAPGLLWAAIFVVGAVLASRRYLRLVLVTLAPRAVGAARFVPLLAWIATVAALVAAPPLRRACVRLSPLGRAVVAAVLTLVAAVSLNALGCGTFAWGSLAPYSLLFVVCILFAATSHEALATGIAIAAVAVAVGVIVDAGGIALVAGDKRPGGLLGNRNFSGEYVAIALPIVVMLARESLERWLLATITAALVLTRCRAGWIGAAVAIAILAVTSWPAVRHALLPLVVGVVVALVVPTRIHWTEARPYAATLRRLVEVDGGSGALRVEQYRETFAAASGHWLCGFGPGRWQQEIGWRDVRLAQNFIPNSDYLRAFSDGGLPALAALVACYGCALVAAWRRRHTLPSALPSLAAAAIISAANAPLFRLESLVLIAAVVASATHGRARAATSERCTAAWSRSS